MNFARPKHILTGLIAVTAFSQTVFAQTDPYCDINIENALNDAAVVAAESAYNQLQLTNPPRTSDISCIDAILKHDVSVLISVPNLADALTAAIEQGCDAAQAQLDRAQDNLRFDFNSNDVLQGAGIPGGNFLFNNTNRTVGFNSNNQGGQGVAFPNLGTLPINRNKQDLLEDLFK